MFLVTPLIDKTESSGAPYWHRNATFRGSLECRPQAVKLQPDELPSVRSSEQIIKEHRQISRCQTAGSASRMQLTRQWGNPDMAAESILILDDEAAVRETIADTLQSAGYSVEQVSSVETAIPLLAIK